MPVIVKEIQGEVLEGRVQRLEDAVSALQDTDLMEERVAERVVGRLNTRSLRDQANAMLDAGRLLMPKAIETLPPANVPPLAALAPAESTENGKSTWFFVGVLRELRMMLRMYADYRYQMTMSARFAPLLAIVLYVFVFLFTGGFLGNLFERFIGVLLALAVYRVMLREADRYEAFQAVVNQRR